MSQALKKAVVQITAQGSARMLHDDEVNLAEFGPVSITRASHVEWCPAIKWHVRSARTFLLQAWGFETRAEALEWERNHYSPGGKGWLELITTEENKS